MGLDPRHRYPAGVSPAASGPSGSPADTGPSLGRVRAFGAIAFLLFSMLVARLWYLQILRGAEFIEKSERNRTRQFRMVAPRGVITDRDGKVLVSNGAQFTVFVEPKDLPKDPDERGAVLDRLYEVLKQDSRDPLTPERLEKVKAQAGKKNAADPIPTSEGVDDRTLARIAENKLDLPGVHPDVEPVRQYVYGKLGAHVLGQIGPMNEKEYADPEVLKLGYKLGDFIGKDGVEKQYDHLLNGTEGGVEYEVDAKGRRKQELGSVEPVVGATLRLTLVKRVQEAAEKTLSQHKGGAAVMVDVRTGRVLAMTSYPTFDPNVFARRPLPAKVWNALNDPKLAPLVNRSISSIQPPGSTFKIVTSAAGLATGKIGPHTSYYCGGGLHIGRFFRCHSTHGGGIDLTNGLAASCDVFYYSVGRNVGPTRLAEWGEHFGIGVKTGVDLPHEYKGRMPSPAWKHDFVTRFMKGADPTWYEGETLNTSIGQGDILTTPLQICLVSAAIANGGTVYKPYVLEDATDFRKKKVHVAKPEVLHKLPLTPQQIQRIATAMRSVVAGPRGTAKVINIPDIPVAGKTGTAEKKSKQTGQDTTLAWFTGYAPFDKPEVAMCVLVESGQGRNLHGGSDAAPIAKAMLEAYYKNKMPEPPKPKAGAH